MSPLLFSFRDRLGGDYCYASSYEFSTKNIFKVIGTVKQKCLACKTI